MLLSGIPEIIRCVGGVLPISVAFLDCGISVVERIGGRERRGVDWK